MTRVSFSRPASGQMTPRSGGRIGLVLRNSGSGSIEAPSTGRTKAVDAAADGC
jgi:hypothetical protein